MRIALLAAVVLVTACGASGPRLTGKPVAPAEWRAVLQDWYANGRDLRGHTCGAVIIAIEHLPIDGPIYSTAYADLHAYAKKICTDHPQYERLVRGLSDQDVAALAGLPRATGYRCWLYAERRVCFTRGRATLVQRVVHG